MSKGLKVALIAAGTLAAPFVAVYWINAVYQLALSFGWDGPVAAMAGGVMGLGAVILAIAIVVCEYSDSDQGEGGA